MKMFVANTSVQAKDFQYRIPGTMGVRRQMIPLGGQIQLTGDLATEDVQSVVEQHAPYGMVSAATVKQATDHIYLLYSIDKPVTADQMRLALQRNLVLMGAEGAEMRQRAAVAADAQIRDSTPQAYRGLEVEVREEDTKEREGEIRDTVIVTRDGKPLPGSAETRKRGALRRRVA